MKQFDPVSVGKKSEVENYLNSMEQVNAKEDSE
jgi:hypothetical protein